MTMTEKQIGDAPADLLAGRINSDKPAKLDQNGRPQQMMKLPCSGKGSPHLGRFPDKPFLHDGICHGGVRAMAARLLRDMRDDPTGPVCLAAEQKPLLAAALTATLAGGPPLLLPYAPTPDALEQLRRAVAFTRMITDDPALTPETAGGEESRKIAAFFFIVDFVQLVLMVFLSGSFAGVKSLSNVEGSQS